MARADGWKNRLVMLLIRLLRPRTQRTRDIRRILVVSTTALGDTLWATPTLANLRASFPHAWMTVFTSPIGREALTHNPHVDQFIVLQEPVFWHFCSLWRSLRKGKFDVALHLHSSQRLVLPLLAVSGISRIIGMKGRNKGLDRLLTDPLDPLPAEHEIEGRERITGVLGVKPTTERLSYVITLKEQKEAESFLGPKKSLRIALHLGAKDVYRRVPQRSWIALGRLLSEKLSCTLFLTGTHSEHALIHGVARHLSQVRLLMEPLRRFAALLDQMDLLICADTGPLHLACALNLPVVALFSPSDPKCSGPHRAPLARVIARTPTCTPCLKRRCQEPFCYLQITPEEIYQTILSFGMFGDDNERSNLHFRSLKRRDQRDFGCGQRD
jgi:ADP-heptose:LPS heptosyltransferase